MAQTKSPVVWNSLMTALLSALVLLTPGAAGADPSYRAQVLVRGGDTIGDLISRANWLFQIGGLNDRGQLGLVTGGDSTNGAALVEYADGKWVTIAMHGRPGAPEGTWPTPVFVGPPKMNQNGDLAFLTSRALVQTGREEMATYRWELARRTVTAVATKGMPATDNLIFGNGGFPDPVINNHGKIAFTAAVNNTAGKLAQGVFITGDDGKIQPIVLPDQVLPGGAKVREAFVTSISDNGAVLFGIATSITSVLTGAFLWEQGVITPTVVYGMQTTDGKKVLSIDGVWINNKDRTVLVAASTTGRAGSGLYRCTDEKLIPIAVYGQEMPGGGQLADVDFLHRGVSWPNERGQYAFYAQLIDKSKGAYLLDADGRLGLILKEGASIPEGTITKIAPGPSVGVALNSQGQVALPVQIDRGANAVVLLTPVTP